MATKRARKKPKAKSSKAKSSKARSSRVKSSKTRASRAKSSKAKSSKTKIKKRSPKAVVQANVQTGQSRFRQFFSFGRSSQDTEKKNFATDFQYGNFQIHIKSTVKNGKVNLSLKVASKNVDFSGNLNLTERSFYELQRVFDHITRNLPKL